MTPNQVRAMGKAIALAVVVASTMAFAGGIRSSPAPTADGLQRGALVAMKAAGGEWATMQRGSGEWTAHVLRADGRTADVRMDDAFQVLSVDGVPAGASGPSPSQTAIDDDREKPVPATDAERASRAALDATGGGTVEDVDRDREGGATWEVEVIRTDGSKADVLLDAQFRVISVGGEQEPNEGADDASNDDDGHDDD